MIVLGLSVVFVEILYKMTGVLIPAALTPIIFPLFIILAIMFALTSSK